MARLPVYIGLIAFMCVPALGQPSEPAPAFEIADVHPSGPTRNPYARGPFIGGGRYELRTASMLDLIQKAYNVNAGKVVGGPGWLDTDRFDVIAKAPPGTTPDTMKLMLQTLLADRFSLVIHKDTRPLPSYALVAGKKPQLKEGDGTGETGCQIKSESGSPAEGSFRVLTMDASGRETTTNLGPGMIVQYACHNITMAAFAEGLRGMIGVSLGPDPVTDQTGLKGIWTFNVRWSFVLNGPMMPAQAERITVFDALDKQLGLKLETRQVPMPVIVVDSVNRKPTANPPGVTRSLPALPTEFEVAEIKPTAPDVRGGRFQIQPGGRVHVQGMPLKFLIQRAWDIDNDEMLVGAPKFADTDRYDIVAKAPTLGPVPESPSGASAAQVQHVDSDAINLMLRALLIERFNMKTHSEDRPVTAFTLTALKPKLKKADPVNRTGFHEGPGADGKDPRAANPMASRLVTCQNMTMAEFTENLPRIAGGYIRGGNVLDSTGLEGSWDFTLNFSPAGFRFGPGRGGPPAAGPVPEASDPSGEVTLFEAIEKQLGLKLETTKRPASVLVIDHLDPHPMAN